MTRRSWSLLGLVVLTTALSTLPWWRGYGLHLVLPALLGASVLASALPLISASLTQRLHGRRLPAMIAVDLTAWLVFSLVVLTRGDAVLLVRGLWRGPVTLLSYSLPLVDGGWLLAVPVALTWLTGAIAGHALASGRSLGAVVPWWVGGFVIADAGTRRALAATPAEGWWTAPWMGPGALLTAILLVLAAAAARPEPGLVTDPDRAPSPGGSGRLGALSRGVLATVALVASALGGTVVGLGGHPEEVRADRQPGSAEVGLVTPLAYAVQLRSGSPAQTPVLDVETDRPWSGYVALAELDRYDGDSWTFTRRFQPSGGLVPLDPDPGLDGPAPVRQTYRVRSGLAGSPWLPHLASPKRVLGLPIDVDPQALLPVPARDLLVDDRFDVVSTAATATLADVPPEAAFSLSRPPVETQLPAELLPLLGRLLPADDEADLPVARLQALLQRLKQDYRLVAGAEGGRPRPASTASATSASNASADAGRVGGGTAFSDVTASVLGPTRSGTPEQFATLFATAARSIGVPARVVSGFRVRDGGTTGPLAAGARTVTAAQAWTWVELPVQGQGWVVADPTPSRTGQAAAAPTLGARTTKASPTRSAQELVVPSAGGHAIAPPEPGASHEPASHGFGLAWWVPVGLVAALTAALTLVVVLRRRGAFDRHERHGAVVHEWRTALVELEDCGLSGLAPLTANEVAVVAGERFGDDAARPAAVLAELSDRALFSPSRPLRSSDVNAARAARRELARAARAQLRPAGRLTRAWRQGRRLVSSSSRR